MDNEHASIDGLITQVNQHTNDISEIKASINEILKSFKHLSQDIYDRISTATAPNFGHIWAAAGVVVAFALGTGGMALSFLIFAGTLVTQNHSRETARIEKLVEAADERHVAAWKELDSKLQREQLLMIQEARANMAQVDSSSKERHQQVAGLIDSLGKRIETLSNWVTTEAHSDMEELRQRRIRASVNN